MREKILLSDIDGTVLNWAEAFKHYLVSRNIHPVTSDIQYNGYNLNDVYGLEPDVIFSLIYEYHVSEYFSKLPPLYDSVEYINRLTDDGYKIIFISTFGNNSAALAHRYNNLVNVFGKDVVKDVIALPIGTTKKPALLSWANTNTVWVEDHPEHAMTGISLGLNTILIDHDYNRHVSGCHRVSQPSAWKDIYSIIHS